MEWTAKDIYRLRKSLNWTRNQLSSRLGCVLDLIVQFESGKAKASDEFCSQLNQLKKQSEYISDQKGLQFHAEIMMRDQGLSQISKELIDELIETE